ncbi:MAG: hypothetical protein A3B23_00500 [Candidatus Colwellbacteria bacterium RIFCSPLOWO2_01_FULL_48_10]|uniref:HTH arsR-type domain-containing protein n=1 Tax=Candidatus Colwellbacteria bacterium RIFCSPLOWO2_01_FULL_48_10 TaxID=1797690 RepID=A0A1G1Z546_9BACT|nr:MAG: hypothetical protein A3B23_00500 [Candidatus Colwellbacteria bacterium RIFCSPLOWO2_01_FULL_48_10]
MREYEKVLKSLANRRRLEIIKYLKEHDEASVGEIAGKIKLSFKSTSRHLAVLLSADVIERNQRSVSAYYSLTSKQTLMAKNVISLL